MTVRTSGEDFQREFNLALRERLIPRFNVAPTQAVPAVVSGTGRRVELLRWGLIPAWAKDVSAGNQRINARAETLREKPSFRDALPHRRCVVLVDGFYEWRREGRHRVPFHIQRRNARPMAFAGLWDEWLAPSGERLRTCTLITTAPNALMAQLHDRMPLILTPPEVDAWLRPEPLPEDALSSLLRTSRIDDLELRPVSTRVNDIHREGPECLAPPAVVQTSMDLFGLPAR